ncbi:hypothetical protein GUJ93_ZPchr0012g21927 [Zizania palustris]|uniref:CCT domain-containing protein n=1 Tax=Zizania palustris TaxID=103762 RepID=A0A8J5WPY1_ZIZPA|nr:hypothetical protein GUJ93_ZPchr0012g21927 [Zizania palustris]
MLGDVNNRPFEEGISSPIAVHIMHFCDDGDDGDLFAAASEMFKDSPEDASASSSCSATAPAVCSGGDNMSAAAVLSPLPSLDSTLSALLEQDLEQDEPPGPDPELLLPIDDYPFATAVDEAQTRTEQQFSQMSLPLVAAAEHSAALQTPMSCAASELMQLTSGYSDECFAAALAGGGHMGLDEPLYPQQQHSVAMLPAGAGEATAQGCFFSKDAQHAAQGGFFGSDGGSCTGMVMSMLGMDEIGEFQRMMECGGALLGARADGADMAFGNPAAEMQMGGSGSPVRLPAAAGTGTEGSSLDDNSFKAARLSNEERKEKIHRYIKKRNERNFSKKIKYACRKTLADSRPRVRGRFAKNDDYCEASRSIGSQNHEEYEQMAGVKGEDMLDSDALAHINGMNPYMYHQTVESWI